VGAKPLSLFGDCNRLTSFTSASLKAREDVINVAGWLTRIPWWALLLAWSAINVWQAAQLELINDEAYYWMFSRFPDWGYFDHPPMVAWWIILGSWAGGELGVRLASLICWTLGGWLFVQLARPAPATAAVLWYALLPLSSFSSFLALPDAPLCFFTLAFLYALERYLRENTWLSGAAMAVTAAGLLYSKYHGVLIIGTAVLANLPWVRTRRFWACALFGLLLLIPHLYWQWSHGWVSVTYHFFERGRDYQFDWFRVVKFIGTQLVLPGLLLGPWAWTQFAKTPATTPFERTLKAIVWVTVGFFFLSVFRTKVHWNWTSAAYLALAVFLLRRNVHPLMGKLPATLMAISLVLLIMFRLFAALPISGLPIAGFKVAGFRAKTHGWKVWTESLMKDYPECRWTANSYQVASKFSFYSGVMVPSLNIRSRPNQFDFWELEQPYLEQEVCHLDDQQLFPGVALLSPEGRPLTLVKGSSVETLRKMKTPF